MRLQKVLFDENLAIFEQFSILTTFFFTFFILSVAKSKHSLQFFNYFFKSKMKLQGHGIPLSQRKLFILENSQFLVAKRDLHVLI